LDDAIAAGLVIRPDDGSAPYDRFRGRLMFPIRDPRGRCIAFGGRALSPEARAKYLNSPETELFHKGRVLFNQGPAREAAGRTGKLIVAEGYMDVIALARAGLDHAVAPLGTAITEEQLRLFWRIAPEPIIALDGDAAGVRAAWRLVDLALPLLEPGKSLRFCLLPEGQDPDDLIRSGGREGMQRALEGVVSLIEMLWRREVAVEPLDTPERKAALDQRLRKALGLIADQTVRNHYAADIRARRGDLFRSQQRADAAAPPQKVQRRAGNDRRRAGFQPALPATPETLRSAFALKASDSGAQAARIREATILLAATCNHDALEPLEGALEEMTVMTPEFSAIRDALLSVLAEGGAGERDVIGTMARRLGSDPLETLRRLPQAREHPQARPGVEPGRLIAMLQEAVGRHQAQLAYEAELAEATRDLADAEGEDWTWRLRQANAELVRIAEHHAAKDVEITDETAPSPIQRMLDDEVYKSKKR